MPEASAPRRRRASRGRVALLLLAVATAFGAWRTPRLAAAPLAADTGWSVRGPDGEVLRLDVADGGLPLRPGRELHFGGAREAAVDRDGGAREDAAELRPPLREIAARVAPRAEQSSRLELVFRDASTEYLLSLTPGTPPSAALSSRGDNGVWRLDAESRRPADAPLAGDRPASARSFDFSVTLTPGRLALTFDGAPLLDHAAPGFAPPRHARLWIDVADVLEFGVARVADDARSPAARTRRAGSALLLDVPRWAAEARKSARERAAFEALCLALFGALFVSTRAAWERRGAQAALGAALLVLTAATMGASSAERARADARALAAWDGVRSDTPFRLDAPRTLHLGNALFVPGRWGDVTLRARLRVEPGAVLELSARGAAGDADRDVALCLGDRARYGAAFVRQDAERFEVLVEGDVDVPTDRALELELRREGERLACTLDGEPLLETRGQPAPVVALCLLAAAGRVHVEQLQVQPAPPPEHAPRTAGLGVGAAVALSVLLAGALLAAWTARARGTGFAHALAASAQVWQPPALACALMLVGEAPATDTRRTLLVVAVGFGALCVASLRGRLDAAASRARPVVLLGAALPALALLLLVPRPATPAPADARRLDLFPGPRLSAGLASFEHPSLRRYNTWLDGHRFRGLEFAPPKPPGTLRVITAGSSSTVGYGLPPSAREDYPSELWRALRRELPEQPIQVINGAVSASTSARLLRFFREVLVEFEPDVVTLAFTLNDSAALTRLDEHAWLRRITEPDFVFDDDARASAAAELSRGNARWRELSTDFAEHGPPSLALWEARDDTAGLRAPPERFADSLRDWARACDAVGARLVLVKEPVRDDMPLLWKQEFRAALDQVAAEFGLPVVDPTPALLDAGAGVRLFLDEMHPNAAGHAVIARELSRVVAPLLRERAERR